MAIDLAGHGESGGGRDDYTMAAFGADVAAVLEAAKIEDAVRPYWAVQAGTPEAEALATSWSKTVRASVTCWRPTCVAWVMAASPPEQSKTTSAPAPSVRRMTSCTGSSSL